MVAKDGQFQERGLARILYWDTKANTTFGQLAIDYGRPGRQACFRDRRKKTGGGLRPESCGSAGTTLVAELGRRGRGCKVTRPER